MARVISVHEYELKPGVQAADFERALREGERRGLLDLPGLSGHYFLRGLKGARRDAYAAIWIFESREAWERLWGPTDAPHPPSRVSRLANMMPHVGSGKLKLVGVTGATRSKLAPDVPTLAEQDVRSRPSYSWWGLYAPTGTPQPIVDGMYAAIARAVRDKDVAGKFVGQVDMEITLPTSADFADFIKSEVEVWGQVICENKITAG